MKYNRVLQATADITATAEAPDGDTTRSSTALRRLARVVVVFAALVLVPAAMTPDAGAAGSSNVRDGGWSCAAGKGGGYIHFRFPQMWRNNGSLRSEGVWVRPLVMKQVNGRWEYYAHTTVVGLAGPYGMLSTPLYGTWMEEYTSRSINMWQVPVTAGTYSVGFGYRWESTGWGSMFSQRIDSPGAYTCNIPK